MSLTDVAGGRGLPLGETLCQLLLEEELKIGYLAAPPVNTALWRQVSRDSLELLARPDYMACSDITPAGGMPHPRCYGAYPRFLGRLRRRFGVLSLEQMIQRMTDNPARRFGIRSRGAWRKAVSPTSSCSIRTASPTPPPTTIRSSTPWVFPSCWSTGRSPSTGSAAPG